MKVLDYFSIIENLENQVEKLYVRGPLVIGIANSVTGENQREYMIKLLYDYEDDKIVKIDLN